MISKTLLTGYLIWGLFIAVLFCLRPGSKLHKGTLETAMGLSPSYNGEIPDYTDPYEHICMVKR